MLGRYFVLFFVRFVEKNDGDAIKQLIGFENVNLNGGEEKEVEFIVSLCEYLSRVNKDGLMEIYKGVYFLCVGEVEY